jgi:hypothetical protein
MPFDSQKLAKKVNCIMTKLSSPDQLSFETALDQLADVIEAMQVIGFSTIDGETTLYVDNHTEHFLIQSAEMLREVITQGRQILNGSREAAKEVEKEVEEVA